MTFVHPKGSRGENVEGKISVPWERFSETQPVVPNLMGKPPLTLFFPYGISAEPGKSEKKAKNAKNAG